MDFHSWLGHGVQGVERSHLGTPHTAGALRHQDPDDCQQYSDKEGSDRNEEANARDRPAYRPKFSVE
jgi:hypothetical protein